MCIEAGLELGGEAAEPSVFIRKSRVRRTGPEAAQLIAHY